MLLRARWVLPVSAPPLEDGAVLVRGGRIHDVGPARLLVASHPEERVRDLGRAALLPGFVNAHCHLELTLLRGLLDDLPFFPWIRRLVELTRGTLQPSEAVFYSLLGAAEMIRSGITCVGDCTATGAPFDALAVSGLRGIVFQEAFGPTPDLAAAALPVLRGRLDALESMATERLRPGISPHSPYLACPEMLEAVARLAEERRLPLALHLAESRDEDEFVRDGTGTIAEHQRGRGWTVTPRGCSPVEHLAREGWLDLGVPVQLVHLARASASDLDLVAKAVRQGRAVGVVACPRSNAKLGNGLPALSDWDAAGLPWGLGTDGAPAVGSCDPFSEMRFALLAERGRTADATAATARAMLERATLGAARALGVDSDVGSLERGKQADLCAVDLSRPRHAPVHDPCSALVLGATLEDVVLTMVAGEVLYDGRTLTTIDEERVLARCLAGAPSTRQPPPAPGRA